MSAAPLARPCLLLATMLATAAFAAPSAAAPGDISTVAGIEGGGLGGDGGPATAARLAFPEAVAPAPGGGFLIGDAGNARVRRVSADGLITTAAGTTYGFSGDGGPATAAQLRGPQGIAPTRDGGYLLSDTTNAIVRKVSASGTIATVAGTPQSPGFAGDQGSAVGAQLDYPTGLAELPDGGFLISDTSNNRVRRVFANGTIVTVAGTTTAGYSGDGGPATAARLATPWGISLMPDGGFLIADSSNHRIRRVRADGTIVTVAGAGASGFAGDGGPATSALLDVPDGVAALADGGFLIADTGNDRIRRVSAAGVITTVAGTTAGFSGDGGPATAAQLHSPTDVAVIPQGGLLIADFGNARIRAVEGPASGTVGVASPGAPPPPPVAAAAGSAPAPRFGPRTGVALSLRRRAIVPSRGLAVVVANANAFAISGSLSATGTRRGHASVRLATRRFAVVARGRAGVVVHLSSALRAELRHRHRLTVALTARVVDPAGTARTIRRRLAIALAR